DFLTEGASWKGAKASPDSDILLPTRWVALKGLDIDAMKAAWEQIRKKQNAHWKLLSTNCATVAARVLKAGGGDDHGTASKNHLVWWPTDVIRYAKSMKGLVQFTSSDPPGAGGCPDGKNDDPRRALAARRQRPGRRLNGEISHAFGRLHLVPPRGA